MAQVKTIAQAEQAIKQLELKISRLVEEDRRLRERLSSFGTGVLSIIESDNAGITDHGSLGGLGDDDHALYALNSHRFIVYSSDEARLTNDKVLVASDGINVVPGEVGVLLSINLASVSGLEMVADELQIADSIAGAGLTISSKVLAVGAGLGITVNANDVALTTPGSITSTSTNSSSGNHTHAADSTLARSAITITAGAGLLGGGNLTANRTIDVGAGTLITVAADSVSVSNGTAQYQVPITGATPFTPSWTNLSALAGTNITFSGGQFNATGGTPPAPDTISVTSTNATNGTHTHAVDHSSNPGASQKILSSTAAGYLQLVRLGLGVTPLFPAHIAGLTEQLRIQYDTNNRASMTVASDGDLTISTGTGTTGGELILDPVANTVRPANNYDVNLGINATRWKEIQGAELHVQNMVPRNDGATVGGRVLIASNTFLIANVSA